MIAHGIEGYGTNLEYDVVFGRRGMVVKRVQELLDGGWFCQGPAIPVAHRGDVLWSQTVWREKPLERDDG